MERGRRPPDPAACALLASGQTPAAFADIVAYTFFPALDMTPPPFTAQNCLPAYAGPWVKSAKQQASETIHLIRWIAKKSGGANSNMARLLVRSILQPRLVYRAQFHHLTLAEWARLEAINHEAMPAITGLPRITPFTVLQQEFQLNTIDELVHQRRCARNLKPSTFCSVAGLARYMGQEVHHTPSEMSTIAPWNKKQLTENNPLVAFTARFHARRTPKFPVCFVPITKIPPLSSPILMPV
ncbi:hypothetical protein HPB52_024196 [Rhipicephalus sanguineus]|uniref:Uncharacterized protein n=1 Tax=Rhipicephalus sanguineus TaxID=34632 RepID=A0A9D4PAR0_RHISA|nr:hypothetical protein HPB52_024196 [Rhipicephalus sanguineus]